MKKIAISLSVILYAVIVPYLEINDTHVFSPDWTPHARIHEVWQLITNSTIGLFCLFLVWGKNETKLSAFLSLLVMGGFLIAFLLQDTYGGDMRYEDGTEKTVLGINIGVFGFGMATSLILISFLAEVKKMLKSLK